MRDSSQDLKLSDGCRIGVVGRGPAGSFFSYFLLDMAQDLGLDAQLDLYEPGGQLFDWPVCDGVAEPASLRRQS